MTYETLQSIRYSPDHWPRPLVADLYLPAQAGLAPAAVTVHGGGWDARDRSV